MDLEAGELRKHGHKLKLQEKPFQILTILLERPGRVVSREELVKRLWPDDTFVDFERGLNTAIRKLRSALGDSAEEPHYIETVARRGYRFIGTLHKPARPPTAEEPPALPALPAIDDAPKIEKVVRAEPPALSKNRLWRVAARLQGSNKINVVPPEAAAEIDCRLLPDQDHDEFIALLESIINDPKIRIEKIMGFTPSVSTTDTELYRAIRTVCEKNYPEADVVPMVSTGFTDSHFFRDLGIVSYGFDPTIVPAELDNTVHGNDERVPVESVKQGVRQLLEILELVVY